MSALKQATTRIFGHHTEWSAFEKTWLTIFTALSIGTWYATGDNLLGLISSLSGILCVVLVAKGKISNYLFGLIQTGTYGYIALTYGLLGETMLNWGFYLPAQFIGFYLWNKNQNTGTVETRTLPLKGWATLTLAVLIGWAGYTWLLNLLGGNNTGLDSATNVLSIAAQILMLYRFREQWLLWITVNVLSITLWVTTLLNSGGGDWSLVVMWTAFLANSIYGWHNWGKLNK